MGFGEADKIVLQEQLNMKIKIPKSFPYGLPK